MIPEDEAECAAWLHKLYQEKVGRSVLKVFLTGTGFPSYLALTVAILIHKIVLLLFFPNG